VTSYPKGENLVVGIRRYVNTKNEILRFAQDDIGKVIPSLCHSGHSFDNAEGPEPFDYAQDKLRRGAQDAA